MSIQFDPTIFPGSMRSRFLKGFGANVIGQGLNVASKILLVPLFLQAWGTNVYGEWLVLSSFVAYISLTDLGGQAYIVNRLTQAYSRQDLDLFQRSFHSGMMLFLCLPVMALSFLLFLLGVFPLEQTLGVAKSSHSTVITVVALLGGQFLIALPQGLLLGVYRAIGLLPTSVMFGNLIIFLQLVFTSLGLIAGFKMVIIAILQVLPYVIVSGVVLQDLHKRFPQLSILSLHKAEYRVVKTFVRPSLHFLAIQVSQLFCLQGTILIAGALLGSIQVVLFSSLRTIANSVKQLLGLITHTVWPEFTRLDTEDDKDKLYTTFRFVLRTSLAGACLFFVVFHLWGENIFRLWLGDVLPYKQALMDLVLLYVVQLVFWTACSHLLMSINRHEPLARMLLVSSLFTVGLSYMGTIHFGLVGMIFGMILADTLIPLWFVPLLLSKYSQHFTGRFFVSELLPVMATVCVAMVNSWLGVFALVGIGLWWFRYVSVRFMKKVDV